MKKAVFLINCIIIVLSSGILSISCSKQNPIPTGLTTPTPAVYVGGKVLQAGGSAYVSVWLNSGSSSGAALSGATVTVNGTTVPETYIAGVYGVTVTGGFTTGTIITISAITSIGTVTGSAAMPAGATVTAPADNSTLDHTAAFQVNWTGPGPDGSDVWIYAGNPTIPTLDVYTGSPATGYNVPANTLPASPLCYISVLADKNVILTNAVPASSYTLYNSANIMTVTIN
jgi:hypothetical protein